MTRLWVQGVLAHLHRRGALLDDFLDVLHKQRVQGVGDSFSLGHDQGSLKRYPNTLEMHRADLDHVPGLFGLQDPVTAASGHPGDVQQLSAVDHVVVCSSDNGDPIRLDLVAKGLFVLPHGRGDFWPGAWGLNLASVRTQLEAAGVGIGHHGGGGSVVARQSTDVLGRLYLSRDLWLLLLRLLLPLGLRLRGWLAGVDGHVQIGDVESVIVLLEVGDLRGGRVQLVVVIRIDRVGGQRGARRVGSVAQL